MAAFRAKTVKYLVATDVAARGIDVSDVTHVVNYGFPESAEQYVHRTGRTGRAGKRGTAISLITPQDVGNLYFLRLTYGIRPIERALPSASEDRTRRELDRIQLLREGFSGEPSDEAMSLARRLLTADDAERMVAGLVSEFFNIATKQAIARGISPAGAATALLAAQRDERKGPPRATATAAEPGTAGAEPAPRPARDRREPRAPERREPSRDRTASRVAPAADRPRRIDVHHGEGTLVEDESPEVGMEEMRVAVGRRDGVRAGDIARIVRERANLNRRDIGRIHVRDRFSLVSIRAELLDATIAALRDAQLGDHALTPERGKSMGPSIAPPPPDSGDRGDE
jgi:ATP-dependent RNA helicase DeaD